jgi:hypothetical protein
LVKQFALRNKGDRISWAYRCVKTSIEQCEEKFTDYKNPRFGKLFYKSVSSLSAHKVQVPVGYGLQGFKGQNKNSDFRIAYTQCKFSDDNDNHTSSNSGSSFSPRPAGNQNSNGPVEPQNSKGEVIKNIN